MKKSLFLGVDVGMEEHACCLLDAERTVLWEARIANTHEGCQEILAALKKWKKKGFEIWVGMEGRGGYASPLDGHICAAGHKLVNILPSQMKQYRELSQHQPDKDDERDAYLLAEFLIWQVREGRVRVEKKPDPYFQSLKEAERGFQDMNEEKVRIQNQLVSHVHTYWPELMEKGRYFSTTDARGLLAILKEYATPAAVSRAGVKQVNKILSKAIGRDQTELAERLVCDVRRIRKWAQPLDVTVTVVKTMAATLEYLLTICQQMEKVLEELLLKHSYGKWLLEQPGIGVRTAACFMGEAGDLSRFDCEEQLARCAGHGPVKDQSGKSPARYYDGHRYNHRLKRVLLLMAQCRSQHDPESRAYVQNRKQGSKGYWRLIKKLARHLLRFLWKNWVKIVEKPKAAVQA